MLGLGDRLKNAKIIEMRRFGFSHKQIGFYYIKSKQNNAPELLSLLFKHIISHVENDQKMAEHFPIYVRMIFLCFAQSLYPFVNVSQSFNPFVNFLDTQTLYEHATSMKFLVVDTTRNSKVS